MHTPLRFMARRAAVLWIAAVCGSVAVALGQEVSGPDVWAANCGSCHRLRSVATYTASQWNSIATHMALVARLTPAQTRAVREFLVSSAQARQAAATLRDLAPALAGAETSTTSGGASAFELQAQSVSQGPVNGRDIYRTKCAACHGPEGRGNGPAAVAMNPRPTNFTDASRRQATTDLAMGDVIEHGRRAMPAFGRMLSRAQIDSVTAYLRMLSQ
jgi:mono/diheme cytochrome c family protein